MSGIAMATTIEQWNNNKKGTLYMWARPRDLWTSYQEYLMPDEIEVMGKKETHTWKQHGKRRKEVNGVWQDCILYIPKQRDSADYYWLPDLYLVY